jgi:hypothetical protein
MKNFKLTAAFILSIFAIACSLPSAGNSNTATVTNENTVPSNIEVPAPDSAGGQIAQNPPETIVAELYKLHDAQKGPFFQTKSRSLVDKFFTKPFADLIWKANHGPEGEVGAIDFDPLYDGQDFEIKDLKFAASDIKETTATVTANFLNFGEKRSVRFLMRSADGNWKIDDIKYQEQGTLMDALKDYFAQKTSEQTTASGEFEGKYIVGKTSCTVKPVKMAFEVKWAKGSGVEMFYSKGENSFESEDGSKGINRFEFTDEHYNTGLFIRADGKTFPLERAK